MEDKNSESTEGKTSATPKNKLSIQTIFQVVLTLVVITAVYAIYYQQHQKIDKLNADISQKQQNIKTANTQLTQVTNGNSGIVESLPPTTSSNTVSLYNGQVTFTMPADWVTATASHYNEPCYIGGLAAQFCLATTIVVPEALNNDDTTSTYGGITVTVFKHSDATSAADWYTNDFDSAGETQSTGNLTSNLIINGYNAFYVNTGKSDLVYGDQFNNEYYVIVDRSYVVLVTSNVNNNAGANGTTQFNDNSQYSSVVKAFANSIKMQGNWAYG